MWDPCRGELSLCTRTKRAPCFDATPRGGPVGKSRWIELDLRLSRRLMARLADGTEYKHVLFRVAQGAQPFLRLGMQGEIGFLHAFLGVSEDAPRV